MASKFEIFTALHVPGDPVILYNIWDVGSALAVTAAGARALATGSHPVADANGWPDGQRVPLDFALANARRIVEAVDVPLTVDFESAYSTDPEEGGANVARLKETGAVGCNFEDQVIGGEGLHPLDLQVQRISAIRRAVGEDFYINARTDLFLKTQTYDDGLVDQRIVIGLRLEEQIRTRVDEEGIADRAPDPSDPPDLQVERMKPLAADDLILEIAADRAGFGEARHVRAAFLGVGRISPFEIDGQRNLDRADDSPCVGEDIIERDLLHVAESRRIADRVASRCKCLRAGCNYRLRASDVPDVVEDDGIAGHVKRGENLEVARHDGCPATLLSGQAQLQRALS